MTDSLTARASRRTILVATLAAAAPLPAVALQDGATPEPIVAGEATAPRWIFALHAVQDPYAGAMQVPAEVPAGSRAVAIDVEIGNDADQALAFTPLDVRLRDATGIEYRGGAAIGTEPTINPRNLNPGERSRGWVWYIVPASAELTEAVYVAPPPQLRIPLVAGKT